MGARDWGMDVHSTLAILTCFAFVALSAMIATIIRRPR